MVQDLAWAGCLFTLSPNSILSLLDQFGSSGQLAVTTTGVFYVAGLPGGSSASNLTSINTGPAAPCAAALSYLTDAGNNHDLSRCRPVAPQPAPSTLDQRQPA